jgi:hypothetical protein
MLGKYNKEEYLRNFMHSYKLGKLQMKKNLGGKGMSYLNCFANSIGSITILTEDGFVFQGQIVKNREEERNVEENFIFVELTCNASMVTEDAHFKTIYPPIYRDGDIVRINVCNIIAVGPSNGCPTKGDCSL